MAGLLLLFVFIIRVGYMIMENQVLVVGIDISAFI